VNEKMEKEIVELSPQFLLKENWDIDSQLPPATGLKLTPQEEQWRQWIESVRIQVSNVVETKLLSAAGKKEYIKAELGMNIIVPKGKIEQMRFKITLKGDGQLSNEIKAIDGFPKDVLEEKEIIGGKVKLGITKAFKFIPIVGDTLSDLLEVELNPWEFSLGNIRKVNVDFSEESTEPEWYFKEDGFKNSLRVALTIEKPKKIKIIEGDVLAAWVYDPGFFKKAKVGTDAKTVKIY
jgi:hypothetical protein